MDEDVIASIEEWFEKVWCGGVSDKNRSVQMSVHIEEFTEWLNAITGMNVTEVPELNLSGLDEMKDWLRKHVPGGVAKFEREEEAVEELDALCDQIVTAIGVAVSKGYDINAALHEVNRSNYSKFDQETGQPIFDAHGKVTKGPAYFKPDLRRFVRY